MGFFFRKSLNFGPLRVNLSKSGVGFSTGVTGFRIGTGPKGAYIHAGRGGFYYRKTLGTKKTTQKTTAQSFFDPEQSTSSAMPANYVEIESADTDQLTDVSSKDLLEQINKNNNRTQLWPIGIVAAICSILIPVPYLYIGMGAGLVLAFLLYSLHDIKRIPLNYSDDDVTKNAVETMNKIVSLLANCDFVWHIEGFVAEQPTSIKRTHIFIQKIKPNFIETNIEVYRIPVGKQDMYFFPDRLYVVEDKNLAIINYLDIEISTKTVQMEETYIFPKDSRLVSQTWEHTNLNGEPDKRYANNPQISTFEYSNILFASSTGLQEAIQVSNPEAADSFKKLLQQVVSTMKIMGFSKSGELVKTEDHKLETTSNDKQALLEKPAQVTGQQFLASLPDSYSDSDHQDAQENNAPEKTTESNNIYSYWDDRRKEMKEYISGRLGTDAASDGEKSATAKSISRFISERTTGLSGDFRCATIDGHPTYTYAEKDKDNLPVMLKCCQAELKNLVASGTSPAPFYFERAAIIARKQKNYALEIKICEMLIYSYDLYDDARQHCGIELYPYIKGSPRYENIVKRLPKARTLFHKHQTTS